MVEGYTDVMACHLAGVTTAVASCGTAFGEEHGKVLRRLLHDHEEFRGEIIFTFDGDEAGQKAALKVFDGDQKFVSQTYVSVEPDGLDPCDLRIRSGDAAVRELVARRVPLYRFVLGNVVSRYDLDRADGRVDAMRAAARLVTSVRDRSKVDAFARELAGMVGVEVEEARAEVRRAASRGSAAPDPVPARATDTAAPAGLPVPDPRDPRISLERETLKLVLQQPALCGPLCGDLGDNDFTHPAYRALWHVVAGLGGPAAAPSEEVWVDKVRTALDESAGQAGDPALRQVLNALVVEPLPAARTRPGLGRGLRLPPPGGDRDAPHQRPQVAAAAHQPGRAGHRLQPHVRRAGRAGEPPAHAPGARDRRVGVRLPGRWGGRFRRDTVRLPADVRRALPGERPLAWAADDEGGWVVGTRDRLHLVDRRDAVQSWGWEAVHRADWDKESTQLTVEPVQPYAAPVVRHVRCLPEPGDLVAMVRERVTATVVVQQRVQVRGKQGFRVIGRRPPTGGEVVWAFELRRRPGPRRPGGPGGDTAGPGRGPGIGGPLIRFCPRAAPAPIPCSSTGRAFGC